MQVAVVRSRALRALLVLDAALEFGGAAALFFGRGQLSRWLEVNEAALVAAAVVFAVAGLVVAVIAAWPGPEFVRLLAVLNAGGGAGLWLVALLSWTSLDAEGRWITIAAADTFLALGVAEWLALRSSRSG